MNTNPLRTLGVGLAALAALGLSTGCSSGTGQPTAGSTGGSASSATGSSTENGGAASGASNAAPGEQLDARQLAERVKTAMQDSASYRMEIAASAKYGDQVQTTTNVTELDLSDPALPVTRTTSENNGQVSEMIQIGNDLYFKQPGGQVYIHSTAEKSTENLNVNLDQVFGNPGEVKLQGQTDLNGQQVTHYTLISPEVTIELFVDDKYRIVQLQTRVVNEQVETTSDSKFSDYGKKFDIKAPDPSMVTEG